MKHIAWDQGAIESVIDDLFGISTKSYTTKTMCNKRVKSDQIDNNDPTCQACETAYFEELEAAELVKSWQASIKLNGFSSC